MTESDYKNTSTFATMETDFGVHRLPARLGLFKPTDLTPPIGSQSAQTGVAAQTAAS